MKLDLQGWFHPEEGQWYQEQAKKCTKGWIVEIGSWKGLSTSYLTPILINKPQKLWCIDHWQGSNDQYSQFYNDLLSRAEKIGTPVPKQFQYNLKKLKIPYKLLQMNSRKASNFFKNRSCCLIFLDASHDYNSVQGDLESWWPKVASGGVLAGHNFSNDFSGLRKAVEEFKSRKKMKLNRGPKSIFYFTRD
ncbi:MAG: class I SAM-dependent methyltransferase [Candidatus Helarchaeota archaeon]